MQREPMVYAAAGMIFGFVLGYMVANADGPGVARAVPAAAPSAPSFTPPTATEEGPHASPSRTPVDPNEARALESLAARDKANASVRIELGNLYMDHGQFSDAARWYGEAVALRPEPDTIVDLGACLVNDGKAALGLEQFERALKLSPGHKKASFNKGVALMELGRPKEAVAVWDDLLKRFPDDPQLQTLKRQIEQVRAGAPKPS
jgi:cytochrome c-type biogenesis protein CcmH/NrfG